MTEPYQASRWWVYIIETENGYYYTGITTDIDRRWEEHCAVARGEAKAKGAKFFRSQAPSAVVYRRRFETRAEASIHEACIKKLGHKAKLEMILGQHP